MRVDDRPHLSQVWLIDGPGPEALWPLALDGRFANTRAQWYFPKGTAAQAILNAAAGSNVRPANGHTEDGLFDPLVEEVEEHGVRVDANDSSRKQKVTAAVKAWTDQLVDRSARNNLLFFRDQRKGTLDLTEAPPRPVFDILAGRSRTLTQLVAGDEEALADALSRAKTIHTKSQAFYEERGVHTLYLACGLATWDNQHGAATPAAPVLLAPATLTARGAAQRDFDVQVTGDLEVNPTLLNAVAAEFNVHCDPDELLAHAGMEGAIDTPEELEIAYAWLAKQAGAVPAFSVRSKTVLGNFSYAKLPMVRDLQASVGALADHELVAALAGDPDAQQAIRDRRADVDRSLPDKTPPGDEFLVLDADSSQNYAINKVICGQDLVTKGPPSTGKSQTISNLIACLVARGQTVLFVAEKRAAIDAVLKRLEQVGLHDLVLDLHGGVSSKRQVARSLADALHTNATIPLPDLAQEHRRLEIRRRELNDWDHALHEKREPWAISLFDAEERLLALGDDVETDLRLRGEKLRAFTPSTLEAARENLREFVGLGGLQAASAAAWAGAPVTTQGQVDRARDLVDVLSTSLGQVLDRLEQASDAVGMPTPASVADWPGRLSLWIAARDTLGQFDPAIFDEPLDEFAERLTPLGEGAGARMAAALGDGEYRTAHKRAKALRHDGVELRKAGLLDAIAAAADQLRQWKSAGADGAPCPPDDLDALVDLHGPVVESLEELDGLLGRQSLDGSREEVTARLHGLRADTATLGRLPDLHRLRLALHAIGLGDLVDELASWQVDVEGSLETVEYSLMASIIDEVRISDPRVGGFDGAKHARTVTEFQDADRRHIASTPQRVRRLAAERAMRVEIEQPDEATMIRREAAKNSRHRPVRETFNAAPAVMTSIKPCWVMSPLVVSQVLPNDRPYFDVVIFDEASQVRPAEAIPAIARGRRLVVAGDQKQLPPTDFFSGPTIGSDEEDDESLSAASGDFESILDTLLFLVDWEMLSWHYHSQDERLIAFSNAHLYGRVDADVPRHQRSRMPAPCSRAVATRPGRRRGHLKRRGHARRRADPRTRRTAS